MPSAGNAVYAGPLYNHRVERIRSAQKSERIQTAAAQNSIQPMLLTWLPAPTVDTATNSPRWLGRMAAPLEGCLVGGGPGCQHSGINPRCFSKTDVPVQLRNRPYLDSTVQKGFMRDAAGCVEHSETIHRAALDARTHTRDLCMSWNTSHRVAQWVERQTPTR